MATTTTDDDRPTTASSEDDGLSVVERLMLKKKQKAAEKKKMEEAVEAAAAAAREAAAAEARAREAVEARQARLVARAPPPDVDLFDLYSQRLAVSGAGGRRVGTIRARAGGKRAADGDASTTTTTTTTGPHDHQSPHVAPTGEDGGVVVSSLTLTVHPKPRFNHAVAADNTEAYLFGGIFMEGHTPYYLNDLWRYNVAAMEWRRVENEDTPSSRGGHTLVMRGDRVMALFGGMCPNGELNDVHVMDLFLDTLAWKKLHVTNAPPRRTGHSAVMYREAHMIVFGGKGPQVQLNDTWVFHFPSKMWVEVATTYTPAPRWCHRAVLIATFMYVFGGSAQAGKDMADQNDVHVLPLRDLLAQVDDAVAAATLRSRKGPASRKPAATTRVPVAERPMWHALRVAGQPPCPRRAHAMCPFHNGFVVYGGVSSAQSRVLDQEIGDVYVFDATKLLWTRVAFPRGYRRYGHSMFTVDGVQMYVSGGTSSVVPAASLRGTLHLDFMNVPGAVPREVFQVVHTGNAFTIEVERHHSEGAFDYGSMRRDMEAHHRAYEADLLEQKHGTRAAWTMGVAVTEKSREIAALLLRPAASRLPEHYKSTARAAATTAKENLKKAKAPCQLCGGPLDCFFIPCGHTGVCLTCAVGGDGTCVVANCPVCCQPIENLQRLFAPAYGRLRDRVVLTTIAPSARVRGAHAQAVGVATPPLAITGHTKAELHESLAHAGAMSGAGAARTKSGVPPPAGGGGGAYAFAATVSTLDHGILGSPVHGSTRPPPPPKTKRLPKVRARRTLWCAQGVL